ncbi:MAG: class I SAM-dependent methyltransferase, partial [Gemmatimonadetes bacterium]
MSDERLRHDVPSPWWGEHAHRYAWAREHVREGWRVLDLACGTGFGAAALADAGARVVAADLDHGALVEGAREFEGVPAAASDGGRRLPAEARALVFVRMDGTRLALADASLDLVVSFETLEHTTRYREMLAEFARVLRPDGLLLLSTPNRPVQSPDGVIHNPYHTQEFDRPELEALMRERFEHVEML